MPAFFLFMPHLRISPLLLLHFCPSYRNSIVRPIAISQLHSPFLSLPRSAPFFSPLLALHLFIHCLTSTAPLSITSPPQPFSSPPYPRFHVFTASSLLPLFIARLFIATSKNLDIRTEQTNKADPQMKVDYILEIGSRLPQSPVLIKRT